MTDIPLIDLDSIIDRIQGPSGLALLLFEYHLEIEELKKHIELLEQRLEISRKLKEKPKLYSVEYDPYFDENTL